MTINHKKSSSGAYYVNSMKGTRVDDYYSAGAKEPPGEWFIAKNAQGQRVAFGLKDGHVFAAETDDVKRFQRLCQGRHPDMDKDLVQNAGKQRVALHDFVHTAPKSFAVLWSQAEPDAKAVFTRAQHDSVRDAFDFFSEKGAFTRMGKGSKVKVKTSFIAAAFEHGSSRANDPLLHSHLAILNVCQRPDGSTGSIETRYAMPWQGATAAIYHAGLAWRMREIGCRIRMQGVFPEIDGIPNHVIAAFSQRHEAIKKAVLERQAELGLGENFEDASKEMRRWAWNETRAAKGELSREELEEQWLAAGRKLGFTAVEVRKVMSLEEPPAILGREALLAEARGAVAELTELHATFREPALYAAVAQRLCGRASVADIEIAVHAVQEELVHADSVTNRRDLTSDADDNEVVYTTREILTMERDLLHRVRARAPEHKLDVETIDAFLAEQDAALHQAAVADLVARNGDLADARGLEEEQRAALRRVCTDNHQVTVLEGTAGAGKTFTAGSIAALYAAQGYETIALSAAWKQANNLSEEARLAQGKAIAKWLAEIQHGKIAVSPRSLIIVDEAGMVGAKDMRDVIRAAQDAGAKVLLMGDTLQQSSINAGDALRVVVDEIGSARLDRIRRQRSATDRQAVHEFFAGDAATALDRYRDRIHIASDGQETERAMVGAWIASRQEHTGKSHLMLAVDNSSVVSLNRQAHDARLVAKELGVNSAKLVTMDCGNTEDGKSVDPIEFHEKDDVVFRVNEKESGVFNRLTGTIESIDPSSGRMKVRTEKGVVVDFDPQDKKWLDQRTGKLGLQLGYATTVNASQGLTRDFVFIKDDVSMRRKQAGVSFSRHREDCNVFVDRQARYEAKMRFTDADDWHASDAYDDEECIAAMKKSYSRTGLKESSLDYDGWRTSAGELISPEADMVVERLQRAADRFDLLPANELPMAELPFQREAAYVLKEPEAPSRPAYLAAQDRLKDAGFDGYSIVEAEERGFMSYVDGKPVFNGRRPGDDAIVNQVRDGKSTSGLMREFYPPILRNDRSDEVHVVRTGEDALALWTETQPSQEPPTVIVVPGSVRDATALAHVREILTKTTNPPTIHADLLSVSPVETMTRKRDLSIAARQNVLVLEEAGSPHERARETARLIEAEKEAEMHRAPGI